MREQIVLMMKRLAWLGQHYDTEPGAAEVLGEIVDELAQLPHHPHLRTTRQILVDLRRQRKAHQPVDVAGEFREAHETLSLYLRTVAEPQTGVGGAVRDERAELKRGRHTLLGPDGLDYITGVEQ